MTTASRRASFDPNHLNSCDTEPIHIPGSIQPHGFLLAFGSDGMACLHASTNSSRFLGLPVDSILGKTFADLLGVRVSGALSPAIGVIPEDNSPRNLGVVPLGVPAAPSMFHASAHRSQGMTILEFEPVDEGDEAGSDSIYTLIDGFLSQVQTERTVEDLNRLAARELRRLTGFDRVLVYRFNSDWSGIVIAEDRNDEFPSLIDHRFPASDIPKQAREIYRKNRVRLIPDAGYKAVPIVPVNRSDTGRPLDLTYSSLRSVSPVHIEYMMNMETMASMSMTLLRDGELWGLVSCHNRTPRGVSVQIRTACSLLSQVLSLQLEARDHREEYERRIELKSIQVKLLERMAAVDDYRDGLAAAEEGLLSFASASGAAIVADDRCTLIGVTPSDAEVRRLAAWLDGTIKQDVYSTAALAAEFGEAEAYSDRASGLLAISISKLHPSYVLWFRPELTKTINWAGDPRKSASYDGKTLRISPRKSFEKWQEIVKQTSVPFRQSEIEAAVEFRNAVIGVVLRRAEELAELSGELERSNKELEAFSYSVSHDLRAPFRHIVGYSELLRESAADRLRDDERRYLQAVVSSAKQAGDLVDSLLAFSRMGRQQLSFHDVNMGTLVSEVIQDLANDVKPDRKITWDVRDLPTVSGDVIMLRQVIQNLVSNALKFSESRPETVIEIGSTDGRNEVVFHVRDNGVGFDMKYVDKLFGVFQRLHRMEDFEGTGIGLANVRRVITRHGGRTWAVGEPGLGATFFFSLPKHAKPEQSRS